MQNDKKNQVTVEGRGERMLGFGENVDIDSNVDVGEVLMWASVMM